MSPIKNYFTRKPGNIDLVSIVSLHQRAFPGFFLTFLGPAFLRELYGAILADPSGVAFLVVDESQKLLGFVFGSSQPGGLYTRLIRRRLFHFVLASLRPLLIQPLIFTRLLRALNKPAAPLPSARCATLMSISVEPLLQGHGIGRILVFAFMDECRSRGCTHVNLTTDAVNNSEANTFYHQLGFELRQSFTTPEGRIMNEYVIPLIQSD